MQTALERERRLNDDFREQIKMLQKEIFTQNRELQQILSRESPTGAISRWVKSKLIEAT
jgi:hypothetical protein